MNDQGSAKGYKDYKATLISVLISTVSLVSMVFAILGISFATRVMDKAEGSSLVAVSVAMGVPFLCYGSDQILLLYRRDRKLDRIVGTAQGSALSLTGVLLLVLNFLPVFLSIAYFAFLAFLISRRVFSLIKKHRARNILLSIVLFAFYLVLIIFYFVGGLPVAMMLLGAILAYMSLARIIVEAFSKIHFATLQEIVKKTYAIEILIGLLTLILAFSFVFYVEEEGMTFLDALWYSFAVVTTIGFGDVTVKSVLSRVLSVVLGIYGVIVVALVTSIIVNFYNETKYVGKKEEEPVPLESGEGEAIEEAEPVEEEDVKKDGD